MAWPDLEDGEVARAARSGQQRLPAGEGVGRIAEHQVDRRTARSAHRATSSRTTWPGRASPVAARLARMAATAAGDAVDEHGVGGSPGQGLDGQGPAAGEEIGDACGRSRRRGCRARRRWPPGPGRSSVGWRRPWGACRRRPLASPATTRTSGPLGAAAASSAGPVTPRGRSRRRRPPRTACRRPR